MTLKFIGALLVLSGCGGCGFAMASAQRKEEHTLRQIVRVLEYMECDLQFRQTPLPQLCHNAAALLTGQVKTFFEMLANELDQQFAPDAASCMKKTLESFPDLPGRVRSAMLMLGDTLGLFDLPGQLKGLTSVCSVCREGIQELSENRGSRLRSYQTLGLCAGAALAILFL